MQKIKIELILIVSFFQFSTITFADNSISVTGVFDSPVKSADGTTLVKVRTSNEDIVLNFDKLDKKNQDFFSGEKSQNKKQKIIFNDSAIVKKSAPDMGIRQDCSELPTDIGEIEGIAKNSKNMLDFLKNIPQGSLQGFTFVTNSLSLHRGQKDKDGNGQVSPMWPRVLRTSMDGKMTVSFVCDPKNPSYGKVEIMHFDEKENKFKMTEIDFGHAEGKDISPVDRVHRDPVSCIGCHGGSEINGKSVLKPNWGEYFQWSDCQDDRGIQLYGGNDDNMKRGEYRDMYRGSVKKSEEKGCSNLQISKSTLKEQENWLKFRELQRGNECFNSLPWPKKTVPADPFLAKFSYEYYPYSTRGIAVSDMDSSKVDKDAGYMNLSLRNNLRLTLAYAKLLAKQIAQTVKDNPDYEKFKYLLLMSEANCSPGYTERRQLVEIMPNFKGKNLDLDDFAKYSGLNNQDWTMVFGEKDNSKFNAALPGSATGSVDIKDIVVGNLTGDISQSSQAVAKATDGMIDSNQTAAAFGKRFSCIDELGEAYNFKKNPGQNIQLCNALKEENFNNYKKFKELQATCTDCKKVNTPDTSPGFFASIFGAASKVNDDSIARGKKLVESDSKGKCVMCHSASADLLPKDYRFIPSEKDPNKAESMAILKARQGDIADKIEKRLIKDKTMPPIANELTDQDRQDVKSYLLSIAKGSK